MHIHDNLVILCSLHLLLITVPSPTAPRFKLRCLIVELFFIPFWSFQKGQGKSKSKACKNPSFSFKLNLKWSRDHAHDPCPFSHCPTRSPLPFDCCVVIFCPLWSFQKVQGKSKSKMCQTNPSFLVPIDF